MHVIAVGIDATEIDRIAALLRQHGDRFLRRIYTDEEIAYCLERRDPAPSLAARFAAKEAALKALGTGVSGGIGWRDVEVIRGSGPPQLRFHGAAARRFEAIGARSSLISLTHARALAIAQVLLVG